MKTVVIILICMVYTGCTDNETYFNESETTGGTDQAISKPGTHLVSVKEMVFNPEVVVARAGDTVRWINNDMVDHCITEEKNKAWTSGVLPRDSSWNMVVDKDYDYFCALHQVMKGRITIKE